MTSRQTSSCLAYDQSPSNTLWCSLLITLVGLAQSAIHASDQTAIFPDSIFSASLADTDSLLSNIASRLSLSPTQASAATPLRPSFAFWRQIVEDPSLAPEASVDITSAYSRVLKNKGKHVYDLVSAWYDNWLKGAESEAEVERRLESMLEEVIIGNVLWFGVGGWAGRGKNGAGKEINADFFLYVTFIFITLRPLTHHRPNVQHASCDLCPFPPNLRSPRFVLTIPTSLTPSPASALAKLPRDVRSLVHRAGPSFPSDSLLLYLDHLPLECPRPSRAQNHGSHH